MTTTEKFPLILSKDQSAPPIKDNPARQLDYELAKKAASDIDAFEQLYWKYHGRVFSVCVRMTRNFAESEDITQKVFIQLFQKIHTFRGDSAFTTWLHRMTVNQVLMHFRANKSRREDTTENGELPEGILFQGQNPRTEKIIDNIVLSRAIDRLPAGYRRAVILHDIHGFEHEEIAQMLGCASGTSKSQLFKARRKLRELLTVEQNDLIEMAGETI